MIETSVVFFCLGFLFCAWFEDRCRKKEKPQEIKEVLHDYLSQVKEIFSPAPVPYTTFPTVAEGRFHDKNPDA